MARPGSRALPGAATAVVRVLAG